MVRTASVLLIAIALAGCRREPPPPSPAIESFYALRGLVKGVAADRRSVTIDHEEIPGFMPRMEMEYVVADPALLDGIEPGAEVEGTLRMRGRGLLIVRLQKRRPGPAASTRAG